MMNARLFLLLTLALPASAAPMTARFDNDDEIPGELAGIAGEHIVWKSPAFANPSELRMDRLEELVMPGTEPLDPPPGDHVAVLTLSNGDEVRGNLTTVTEEIIGLETSYAGDLEFRRDMVADILIRNRPEVYYAGPTDLDAWHQSTEGAWELDNGVLRCVAAGPISQEIGEYRRLRVAFDVEWNEQARLSVYFHADDPDWKQIENGFELVCQRQHAYLRKRTMVNRRSSAQIIGNTGGIREFAERDKLRVEIFHDRTDGRIRFMLDGRRVADWRDPMRDNDNLGGYLHFLGTGSSNLGISRIRVTSWDGIAEGGWQEDDPAMFLRGGGMDDEEAAESGEEPADDRGIGLRNGDRIEGDIVGIEEGRVRLDTEFKEFELPVSRLRSFPLRTAEEAADPETFWKPIRRRGDIRAHFTEGGHITFQLTGLEDGKLQGRSQTFGEAAFDFAAFTRLEFNLYALP